MMMSLLYDISLSNTACPHVHTASMECKSWVLHFHPAHVSRALTVNWFSAEASMCGMGDVGKGIGEGISGLNMVVGLPSVLEGS